MVVKGYSRVPHWNAFNRLSYLRHHCTLPQSQGSAQRKARLAYSQKQHYPRRNRHTHAPTNTGLWCGVYLHAVKHTTFKYLLKPIYGVQTLNIAALVLWNKWKPLILATLWVHCSLQCNKSSSQECIVYISHLVRYNWHFVIATIKGVWYVHLTITWRE